jgi:hypothetical protein
VQGHKKANFHPVEFRQKTWGMPGDPDYLALPFYEAEWHRNDVKMEDREAGIFNLGKVRIEISGITSNLLYYSKTSMPVGSDFEVKKSK